MNAPGPEHHTRRERTGRWLALLAGGPLSFLKGLSAIVAMLRAA